MTQAAAALPADDRPGSFGPGALAELPRVVEGLGLTRLLLVTGRHSFTASGGAAVLPELQRVAAVETWSDFSPNPVVEDVAAGCEVVRAFAPDAVVAVGGGSALDIAKLVAVFGDLPAERVRDAVRGNLVEGRTRSLILVPTTSGSGSEATHFAVAYVDGEKYSVAHPALLPDYVVLDPSLTTSASRYQKATSVVDAIAQAVESHWARNATEASRAFALAALHDLVPAAEAFLDGDPDATVRAARGSHLAGRAIDLSKTTGAHAMAYALTQRHGVSHGHAVATTLGGFARLHAEAAAAGAGAPTLAGDLDAIARAVGVDAPEQVGDRLDQLAGRLGLELRLGALGVPEAELPTMADAVNHERLANNPLALDPTELRGLLQRSW